MREYITETKITQIINKLVCDKCGQEEEIGKLDTEYVIEFSHTFGYGSEHDFDKINFDLCEKCLFNLLSENGIKYRMKSEQPESQNPKGN